MGLIIKRDSWQYFGAISGAAVTLLAAIIFTWVKTPSEAWMYSLHPTFMGIAVVLMVIGTLENSTIVENTDQVSNVSPSTQQMVGRPAAEDGDNASSDSGTKTPSKRRLVHVACMVSACVSFILGWLFMFLQHNKGKASHFAWNSPKSHKLHVYGGYIALLLILVQVGSGIIKFAKLPFKSVTWHGILARVLIGLIFFWVLAFAAWAGLTPGKLVAPDSSLAKSSIVEILFMIAFIVTGAFVFLALHTGVRPEVLSKNESRELLPTQQ